MSLAEFNVFVMLPAWVLLIIFNIWWRIRHHRRMHAMDKMKAELDGFTAKCLAGQPLSPEELQRNKEIGDWARGER